MYRASISEAKAQLSRLVEAALQGEEVIITRGGKPVVKLLVLDRTSEPRDLDQALWRGKVWIADDFDSPLESDLLDSFERD